MDGFIEWIKVITMAKIVKIISWITRIFRSDAPSGQGGNGGNAKVCGNGTAIGGSAGKGGNKRCGRGGNGGDASIMGDGIAIGGTGGDAGRLDGTSAKGGMNVFEALGRPNIQLPDGTYLWDYGKGGDGASATSIVKDDE